jgi:PAS domain S-box-containing protein
MSATVRERILIIDAVPSDVQVLRGVLEADYDPSLANSSREALDLLAKGTPPDLILLEVTMPEMDGYEVCQRLEGDPATRDIPVIFITTKTDAESEARAFNAGGMDVIHKPINPAVLRARVARLLELAHHRRQQRERDLGATLDLTQRKHAEQQLRASKAQLATILDHTPIAIYAAEGREQRALYINQTFTTWFGFTPEEVPTVNDWWPLAYPDAVYRASIEKEWLAKVARAMEDQTQMEPMEVVVTCKDGSRKDILWGFVATGSQRWAFGLDITSRKRAEAELSAFNRHLERRAQTRTTELAEARAELEQVLERMTRSEARFRTMVEQAPLGIALTDSLSGKILEVNDRFAAITGRTREEMIRIDWMQITHPDDLPAELDNMARLNAGEIAGFQMDKRYLRPDGAVVWISLTIASVSVAADEGPRHLALIEDITERKRLQAALAESEARYRLAIDTAGAAIWDADLVTGEQVVNDHWYYQLGYAIGEVEPNYACWRSHLHPDDIPMIDQAIDAIAQGSASIFDVEYRVITKDGTPRWHHAIGEVACHDANDRALRVIGTNMDISERVATQQRVAETLDLLRLATEAADIGIWSWEIDHNRLT